MVQHCLIQFFVASAARSRDALIISCNLYSVNLGRKKTARKAAAVFHSGNLPPIYASELVVAFQIILFARCIMGMQQFMRFVS